MLIIALRHLVNLQRNKWMLEPRPDAVTTSGSLSESKRVLAKAFEDRLFVVYVPPDVEPDRELVLHGVSNRLAYRLVWFNPGVGKFEKYPRQVNGGQGKLTLPPRPDGQDWVLVVHAD